MQANNILESNNNSTRRVLTNYNELKSVQKSTDGASSTTNKQVLLDKNVQMHKSSKPFLAVALILTLASFQVGHALAEVTCFRIEQLMSIFNINSSTGTAKGLLVGMMPIGGILGSIINPILVNNLSRKNVHGVLAIFNLISLALIQIPTFPTLLVGRFFLGICCGSFTMITPQYLKQIAPPQLKPLFGSFFSLGRMAGVLSAYLMGFLFHTFNVTNAWRIIFVLPGIYATIQIILIYVFVPPSPVELAEKDNLPKLRKFVERFYKKQYVEIVINQYLEEQIIQRQKSEVSNEVDPLTPNKKRAFIMALHINLYRQMIGINTIVAFGADFVEIYKPSMFSYANLLLNAVQGVTTVISTFWLGIKFGRRFLHLSSGVALAVCCYLIAIGYLVQKQLLVVIFVFVYMFIFGLLYSPVWWSYPAEIVPPKQASLANILTWVSLALTCLVPPIIIQAMNNNGWAVFMFFAVYTTISLVYMWKCLVETKGKIYAQFIKQF